MGLSQKLSWETWECHAFFNKKSPEHPVKNIPVYKITQLFVCTYVNLDINGTKYSRMDQVKFVEDSL